MTTPRELLDLIADFVEARAENADQDTLQRITQKFDVTLSEAVGDRASVQSEA